MGFGVEFTLREEGQNGVGIDHSLWTYYMSRTLTDGRNLPTKIYMDTTSKHDYAFKASSLRRLTLSSHVTDGIGFSTTSTILS